MRTILLVTILALALAAAPTATATDLWNDDVGPLGTSPADLVGPDPPGAGCRPVCLADDGPGDAEPCRPSC